MDVSVTVVAVVLLAQGTLTAGHSLAIIMVITENDLNCSLLELLTQVSTRLLIDNRKRSQHQPAADIECTLVRYHSKLLNDIIAIIPSMRSSSIVLRNPANSVILSWTIEFQTCPASELIACNMLA